MISVDVLYPAQPGGRFDLSYYLDKHMPMVKRLLGGALKSAAVEHGISGPSPGSQPAYTVLCHLRFDSVGEFQNAFGPHANEIMGDIANYSSAQPLIQISEIRMS